MNRESFFGAKLFYERVCPLFTHSLIMIISGAICIIEESFFQYQYQQFFGGGGGGVQRPPPTIENGSAKSPIKKRVKKNKIVNFFLHLFKKISLSLQFYMSQYVHDKIVISLITYFVIFQRTHLFVGIYINNFFQHLALSRNEMYSLDNFTYIQQKYLQCIFYTEQAAYKGFPADSEKAIRRQDNIHING